MAYEYHSIFLASPKAPASKKHLESFSYEVDGVQMARDLQATLEKMAESGYNLFQCTPVVSARYNQGTYTEGFTLIFRKAMQA